MSIQYNYEVIISDVDSGVMEVVYTADGYSRQHIGMPLPKDGEDLEAVIRTYAPIMVWDDETSVKQNVVVGTKGTYSPPPIAEPTYIELRASEYPPMADYLDAIVKGDEAQKQAYIDACLAVKAKYPKP